MHTEHGLKTCVMAKAMVDAMACIDRLVLEDQVPDVVNSLSLEALARKAYALEVAFSRYRTESDWKKPKNAKN